MSKNKFSALVYIKVDFDSEYPESAKQELESIVYNSLIEHNKIEKIEMVLANPYIKCED